jgi:hypothetical protein
LVREKDFKLIDDIQDYILEYLKDKFLKYINASKNIIYIVNTIVSLDGFMIIKMLLKHYSMAYLASWIFWLSLLWTNLF